MFKKSNLIISNNDYKSSFKMKLKKKYINRLSQLTKDYFNEMLKSF